MNLIWRVIFITMSNDELDWAENETRTRDPNLGKVVLYQLSYFRKICLANFARFLAALGIAQVNLALRSLAQKFRVFFKSRFLAALGIAQVNLALLSLAQKFRVL